MWVCVARQDFSLGHIQCEFIPGIDKVGYESGVG